MKKYQRHDEPGPVYSHYQRERFLCLLRTTVRSAAIHRVSAFIDSTIPYIPRFGTSDHGSIDVLPLSGNNWDITIFGSNLTSFAGS